MPRLQVDTKPGARKVIARAATTLTERVVGTTALQAIRLGQGFCIFTGVIAYTTGTSSLFYLDSDEAGTLALGSIEIFASDFITATLVRLPNGGNIITDATAATKTNLDFSSATVLEATTLAFKGKDGGTLTGGTNVDIVHFSGSNRRPDEFILHNGDTFGVTITSTGAVNVAFSCIAYLL